MPTSIEYDEDGNMILTPSIGLGSSAGRLGLADLKPADVLVWYSSDGSRISSAIREFTGGPYSHVGLYVGNGFSVDAGPAGVQRVSVKDLLAVCSYARVMRAGSLSAHKQAAVVTAACAFEGRGYAWFDSLTLPLRRRAYFKRYPLRRKLDLLTSLGRWLTEFRRFRPPSPKNTFCSRMVVEAFGVVNYFSSEFVKECVSTPNDLAAQSYFTYEGWLCDTDKPTWHPLDPYSPKRVRQRRWHFSLARIFLGTSVGGK